MGVGSREEKKVKRKMKRRGCDGKEGGSCMVGGFGVEEGPISSFTILHLSFIIRREEEEEERKVEKEKKEDKVDKEKKEDKEEKEKEEDKVEKKKEDKENEDKKDYIIC
ncbi:hypothetical protein Pmani_024700 [Petrolisthes manimaculis]|uniref:Uncharacterized protein n=1 Tax=Petrolisthes manimaculis TaxID=1843537 RepID=A0AAE1P982_9EUCA|nr:hypothetical protein Pmani_024700 [Petrolisthes manimaculis]